MCANFVGRNKQHANERLIRKKKAVTWSELIIRLWCCDAPQCLSARPGTKLPALGLGLMVSGFVLGVSGSGLGFKV